MAPRRTRHAETHRVERVGWLRAAVLGANDGIVSTASLILGVAGGGAGRGAILIAGVAGLVAGAMSMAAGEYVSVSSQGDAEDADLEVEKRELRTQPRAELEELTRIYMRRGLDRELAVKVAEQLSQHDALGAHARDELGITKQLQARPVQAALASAASFSGGAIVPVLVAYFSPSSVLPVAVTIACVVLLAISGALGAYAGGASLLRPTVRVTVWGAFAMAVTYGVGRLFGVAA
jgi:VIT1/CCC1 family predicted Fe2+/Mn2+ transporter